MLFEVKEQLLNVGALVQPLSFPDGLPVRTEGESLNRLVVEASEVGVWALDVSGATMYVNSRTASMLGYPAAEMLGRKMSEFIERDCVLPDYRKREHETITHTDVQFRKKNGSVLWAAVSMRTLLNQDGALSGSLAVIRDISDRTAIERALRSSERKHRTLFESMVDGFASVDMSGRLQDANATFLNLVGYDREELLRLTYQELTPERWLALERSIIESQVIPNGSSTVYEKEYRRKDGSIVPVELRTFLLKNELHECEGMWAIVRDISPRKESERALTQAEFRYHTMADFAFDWELWLGPDGGIRHISPSCERITGYTKEDFIKDPQLLGKIVVTNGPNSHEPWSCAADAGDGTREFMIRRRDGSVRWIEQARQSVYDQARIFLGYRISNRDITERKEIEKALIQREEEYRLLMDQAADAIIMCTPQGEILAVNVRAAELFGCSKKELVGKAVGDLVPREDLLETPLMISDVLAGNIVHHERRFRRSCGSYFLADVHVKLLSNGKFQAILRDITDRKRGELDFKKAVQSESHEKLFLKVRLFTHGQIGCVTLNRIALLAENLPHTTRLDSTTALAIEERMRILIREFTSVVYPELVSISSLMRAVVTSLADDPDEGKLDEKGVELAQYAEDLKRAVDELWEYMESDHPAGTPDTETIRSLVPKIKDVIRDARHIFINGFTVKVSDVLRQAVEKHRQIAGDITIALHGDPGQHTAIIRPADLCEIMSILIENAIEALAGEPAQPINNKYVTLWTESEGSFINIVVCDNGPGVPKAMESSLFLSGATGKSAGRGFGLSFARRTVEKYGGSIEHHVPATGGACFTVRIPRS